MEYKLRMTEDQVGLVCCKMHLSTSSQGRIFCEKKVTQMKSLLCSQVVENAVAAVKHLRKLGCHDIEFSPEDASRSEPRFLCRVLSEVKRLCSPCRRSPPLHMQSQGCRRHSRITRGQRQRVHSRLPEKPRVAVQSRPCTLFCWACHLHRNFCTIGPSLAQSGQSEAMLPSPSITSALPLLSENCLSDSTFNQSIDLVFDMNLKMLLPGMHLMCISMNALGAFSQGTANLGVRQQQLPLLMCQALWYAHAAEEVQVGVTWTAFMYSTLRRHAGLPQPFGFELCCIMLQGDGAGS